MNELKDGVLAVKKFRISAGWTQGQLAHLLNVSQSTVGMWGIGDRKPDIIM